MPDLCTIEEIAEEWNVPKASLRTAAERHGFLVRIGRAFHLGLFTFDAPRNRSNRYA